MEAIVERMQAENGGVTVRTVKAFMSKITEYLKDTRAELKHVIWPTRRQTFYYTLIVIILSLIIAYYLGIFDFLFSQGLQKIITP